MKFLTILTPTYNREECLKNLYESLKRQINKNFVWYVMDDGSTDGTEKLIKKFQRENLIDIIYDKKKNDGKHRAINYAAKKLDSELTMIVDSDDLLTADATETIFNDWMENCDLNQMGGLNYLRGYSGFEYIGDQWPHEEQVGNTITHTCNKGIKGDKAEVLRTDILKQYPFPEYNGEKFFSECYLWIEMAKNYNIFMRNKIIYITKYLDDGLTKSGRKMQIASPKGARKNAEEYLYKDFSAKIKFHNGILYNCYGLFAGESFGTLYKESPSKFWTVIGALPGLMLYKKWKKENA